MESRTPYKYIGPEGVVGGVLLPSSLCELMKRNPPATIGRKHHALPKTASRLPTANHKRFSFPPPSPAQNEVGIQRKNQRVVDFFQCAEDEGSTFPPSTSCDNKLHKPPLH